jgi:hypothetical protein
MDLNIIKNLSNTKALVDDFNNISEISTRMAENIKSERMVLCERLNEDMKIGNILDHQFIAKIDDFNKEIIRLLIKFDHEVSAMEGEICRKMNHTQGSHLLEMAGVSL